MLSYTNFQKGRFRFRYFDLANRENNFRIQSSDRIQEQSDNNFATVFPAIGIRQLPIKVKLLFNHPASISRYWNVSTDKQLLVCKGTYYQRKSGKVVAVWFFSFDRQVYLQRPEAFPCCLVNFMIDLALLQGDERHCI